MLTKYEYADLGASVVYLSGMPYRREYCPIASQQSPPSLPANSGTTPWWLRGLQMSVNHIAIILHWTGCCHLSLQSDTVPTSELHRTKSMAGNVRIHKEPVNTEPTFAAILLQHPAVLLFSEVGR